MTGNGHMGFKPGEDAPLVPLVLNMECCETEDKLASNIEASLKRYVRLNEYLEKYSGPVSVCGFGPSLLYTYRDLVGDVLACNGAHDFLIEKGIVPKWCLLMDAAPVMTKLVTPHPDVTYLVASRCHESLFEHLKGFNVITWHCAGDKHVLELLEKHGRMEPVVNGGTASVTRAMVLVRALGYSEIHIFGADSSYEGEYTHVKKSVVEEKFLRVYVDGKWFKTTPWMAGQVEDIRVLCPPLVQEGARFIFHGKGLLQHVAGVLGFEVREERQKEELADFYGPDFAASQLNTSTT